MNNCEIINGFSEETNTLKKKPYLTYCKCNDPY